MQRGKMISGEQGKCYVRWGDMFVEKIFGNGAFARPRITPRMTILALSALSTEKGSGTSVRKIIRIRQ